MILRDHPAIKGKLDRSTGDVRRFKVDPLLNLRDLDDPSEQPANNRLKEHIRANGVRNALKIRLVGEDLYLVHGHRRRREVLELLDDGFDISPFVPVVAEEPYTTDADRILSIDTDNMATPLNALQHAEQVKRLYRLGWDRAEVARRKGVSVQTIINYEEMLDMPEPIREAVREGAVSATNARAIVRESAAEVAETKLGNVPDHPQADYEDEITGEQIAALNRIVPDAEFVDYAPLPSVAEIATAKLTQAKATAKAAGKSRVTARSLNPKAPTATTRRISQDTINVLVTQLAEIAEHGDGERDRRSARLCLERLGFANNLSEVA